jgi:PAS domain S-box-containing protein
MSFAVALATTDGHLSHVTPGFCRMFAAGQDEMLGGRFDELACAGDRVAVVAALQEIEKGVAEVELKACFLAADAREFPGQLTASAAANPDGSGLTILQLEDLTDTGRLAAELTAERHLFDAFLESVPEQVYFKDRESRFIRVSRRQATRLGFDQAHDLIGKTDFDVFGDDHAVKARGDEVHIMRTGQPIIDLEEKEVFRGDGPGREPEWVLTTKLPLFDAAGKIVGTFGISRDITARKRAEAALRESEERWRVLLAHLQEIVVLSDQRGRLVYATPSFQRWTGYDPEELVGQELSTIGHPDDAPIIGAALAGVQPDRPVTLTHRYRHKDGSWHTLESTIISLRENPVVEAVVFASTDITDRITLEQERERLELERRVSHRLEAVGQLAAGIAHEINTPLQFVGDSIVFLQEAVDDLLILAGRAHELLWLDEPLSLEQRRQIMTEAEAHADIDYLLERIPAAFARTADGVRRVRSIVQAMKRFSHPSDGEIAAEDLTEAIETTLAVCRSEYKYVAEVELNLGELPLVPCNLGEINQVLLNLIVNAAQAIEEARGRTDTEPGGDGLGRIVITTRVEGDYAVIQIADDGPGMPRELQERIYEPFFTTKEVGKGTGQGLALARTTVARHDGSLECESAPGVGTTFTIRLPLQQRGQDMPLPAVDATQPGPQEQAA